MVFTNGSRAIRGNDAQWRGYYDIVQQRSELEYKEHVGVRGIISLFAKLYHCRSTFSLSMRGNHEQRVCDQTSDHDNKPIYCQRKTKPSQQLSPPRPALQPTPPKKAFVLTTGALVLVIIFLHQLLVMWRLRRGYLVVEQARKDEADTRASCTTHVGEHLLKRGHCHGHYVAQDNYGGGDGRETCFTQAIAFWLCRGFRRWLQETRSGWGIICGVGTSPRSPFEYCVDGGSTRVDLERVGEHDENDDGGFADGGGD